jgi:hypothetical protein
VDPQFKVYTQQHLDAIVGAQTQTGSWVNGIYYSSGRDGGFIGNTPPPSPAEFHKSLEAEVAPFKPNSWSLDSGEAQELIQLADDIYISAYEVWLRIPLAGDAPPDVVAWWKAGQK